MSKAEDWSSIPPEILAKIFLYVDQAAKLKCSLVCKNWNEVSQVPEIWRFVHLKFKVSDGRQELNFVRRFGKYFKKVVIEFDQANETQRAIANEVMDTIASYETESSVNSIIIKFIGDNPWLFTGEEFNASLINLLDKLKDRKHPNVLRSFDINDVQLVMKAGVSDALAKHEYLEEANIITNTLICTLVAKRCMNFAKGCRNLQVLNTHSVSVDNDILNELSTENRARLKYLTLVFKANDKYKPAISDEAWVTFVEKNPDVKVELKFDHNCPTTIIGTHISAVIPVHVLRLHTYTHCHEELDDAIEKCFEKLTHISLCTQPSNELNEALKKAATKCINLISVTVDCNVSDAVMEHYARTREDVTLTIQRREDESIVGPDTDLLPANAQPVE